MDAKLPKRRYSRIKLAGGMPIAWESDGRRVVSRATTIGLGGFVIATSQPLPVGSVLKLFFDSAGGSVRARGIVRDSKPGEGMGVEFILMSPEGRAHLQQLLKRLMG